MSTAGNLQIYKWSMTQGSKPNAVSIIGDNSLVLKTSSKTIHTLNLNLTEAKWHSIGTF